MTFVYNINTANRANFNTSDMFAIVISKNFLGGKLLPFNMPPSDNILFDLISINN